MMLTMVKNLSYFFASFVPKKVMENDVKKWLVYAGSKEDEKEWAGLRIFLAALTGIIFILLPFSILPLISDVFGLNFELTGLVYVLFAILFGLIGFAGVVAAFYLHISYVIDGRRKMVEAILPDFLFLVGNNLKSGMTPFYAFRSAVRPEFGPLSEQIQIATQKSLGIESFSDALKEIADTIDSKMLKDTAKFFAQAMRSGGKLAQLIEASANDIKHTAYLKREMISSTRMYVLFIVFVVLIASPMLLAVSVQFLNILTGIQTQTSVMGGGTNKEASQQIGFAGGGINIDPDFMKTMAYGIILSNAVLASIFIAVLSGGKFRDGLKYAPVLAVVGLVVFTVILGMVGLMLGSF